MAIERSLTLAFIISNYNFCKMAVSACVRVLRSFLTFIATILVIVKDLGHCQSASTRQKLFQDHFRFTMAEGH